MEVRLSADSPLLSLPVSDLEVEERVRAAGSQLTAAERRVAQVVLERPQLVGFGTVADLAEAAGAGAATVVRLAAKLGFDGFERAAGVRPR